MMTKTRTATTTGGRDATTVHIPGDCALAVGMPPARRTPKGWRWTKLSDAARLESGHTPSRRHPEYWDGDIPWIGIRDARAHHGQTINDTEQHTNDLGILNSSARVLPAHTVGLSRTASVGYVVVMGRAMATSQDFVNWVCSEQLDPQFLKYLFLAEKDALLRFGHGAVHKTIYYPEVKAFYVCLPPLPEQERIVAILDEAFAAIATATANAEKNLANARELFESELEATFSNVGDGWIDTRIDELCNVINGYAFKSTDFSPDEEVRSIKIANVGVREFISEEANFLPVKFVKSRSDVQVSKGDLVIALTRSIIASGFKVAVVPDEYDGALVNQRVAALKPRVDRISPKYLYANLCTQRVVDYVVERVNTLMQPNLSIKDLKALPIPTPPLPEQIAIDKRLDFHSATTKRLDSIYQQKLTSLAELKQSILHKAFTGELTAGTKAVDHTLSEAGL